VAGFVFAWADVSPLADLVEGDHVCDRKCASNFGFAEPSPTQRPRDGTFRMERQPAGTTLRRRSVHRVTDDAEAAELEPSEELLAARALETGLVEEDEAYIYTPDDLQDADVAADYVWPQKGTGRKVYLMKKEQGPASQG
jgi:hypothetical protein